TQTLGAVNSMFDKGSDRATIEWRFDRRGDKQIPYAIIVRFHTSRDGRKGDVLVVSKVGLADTCHVAYIDALANSDAIALARHGRGPSAATGRPARGARAARAGGGGPGGRRQDAAIQAWAGGRETARLIVRSVSPTPGPRPAAPAAAACRARKGALPAPAPS